MPFGPEISWPHGFRPLDPQSREVLESAYGAGPGSQPSAMEDYGDPGYSDPSYEGPRTPHGGPALPGQHGGSRNAPRAEPGYHGPEIGDPSRPRHARPGYPPQAGGADYPEQWYGYPCLDDRVLDDARPSRSADPRLAGMTYGELRYDPDSMTTGEPGYDEPLDDESWYEELRRSTPAPPRRSDGRPGPGGPQRRAEPGAHGQRPGYPQAPDRPDGRGQPGGRGGSVPQSPHGPHPQSPRGPQMSTGRPAGPGSRPGGQPGQGAAAQGAGFLSAPVGLLTPPESARVDAPPEGALVDAPPEGARVDAPPKGARVDAPRDGGALPAGSGASRLLTAPGASRPGITTVRPGHGLDGPEITGSWPVQPAADPADLADSADSADLADLAGGVDSFEDFWQEDEDEEYSGLFGDREAEFERADARQTAARRRTGRRRGRSGDRRLWLGLGGVILVAAAAITGIIRYEFPSHSGPAHAMVAPDKIGSYARTVDLENQADVAALRQKVISMSSGQASHVVSAVYESGNSAAGNTAQILMFIGGHLANADPAASVASFTQQFKGAKVVSAGSLGGTAACVQDGTGSNGVAMCAWFDNDSFGEMVSPTMNATALAKAIQTVRPAVEVLARN